MILQSDGTLVKGLFRDFSVGRLYLTREEIVWKSMLPLPVRIFSCLAPKQVRIDLKEVSYVRRESYGSRAWLVLVHDNQLYFTIRPGRLDDWFLLRDNPETTDAWFQALRELVPTR